jgi:hypothetical protein
LLLGEAVEFFDEMSSGARIELVIWLLHQSGEVLHLLLTLMHWGDLLLLDLADFSTPSCCQLAWGSCSVCIYRCMSIWPAIEAG